MSGCASGVPFPNAERGRCYRLDEFEAAVLREKVAFLEKELSNLKSPAPRHPDHVALQPFMIREFPTWSEWQAMKALARPNDQVCEFHHPLFRRVYDGPKETMKRGYALMRDGRIVKFVSVDGRFELDY